MSPQTARRAVRCAEAGDRHGKEPRRAARVRRRFSKSGQARSRRSRRDETDASPAPTIATCSIATICCRSRPVNPDAPSSASSRRRSSTLRATTATRPRQPSTRPRPPSAWNVERYVFSTRWNASSFAAGRLRVEAERLERVLERGRDVVDREADRVIDARPGRTGSRRPAGTRIRNAAFGNHDLALKHRIIERRDDGRSIGRDVSASIVMTSPTAACRTYCSDV